MPDREKIIEDIEDGILMARATSTRIVHLPVDKVEEILSLLKEQEDLGTELTNAMELVHKKNERIKNLEEQLETITKRRMNAGAFD